MGWRELEHKVTSRFSWGRRKQTRVVRMLGDSTAVTSSVAVNGGGRCKVDVSMLGVEVNIWGLSGC